MPRLREVSRKDVTDPIVAFIYQRKYGDRDPVVEPGTDTGAPGNWETVIAQSPPVFEHVMRGFELWQDPAREIDPLLRELAIVRVGWICECQFCFSQHSKVFRAVGGSQEQLDAIPGWAASELFTPLQRAVLAYADCLALQHGRTPDQVFDELKKQLSEVAIIELTYFTGMYIHMATITKAFRLEFDDIPDRIVEVRGAEEPLSRRIQSQPLKLPRRAD